MGRRWTLALALLAIAACRPTALPGEAVGQYRVLGALEENTCGAGYDAPAELFFHVELRSIPQSTVGYWKLPNAALADGAFDRREGHFRFENRQEVVAFPAQPEAGVAGCTLMRVEVVEGDLGVLAQAGDGGPDAGSGDAGPDSDAGDEDAGSSDAEATNTDAGPSDATPPPVGDPEERFSGTTTVTVSPAAGSECSALLDPSQGGFPFLPCEVRYAIGGTRLAEDIW